MTTPNPTVVLYVDPACPFAWITSRWLLEVAKERPIDLEFRVMSLGAVNEGKELPPDYRARIDQSWVATRIAATIVQERGQQAFSDFYTAFGTSYHTERRQDAPLALTKALAEAGLPAELTEAGQTTERDEALRETQRYLDGLVGNDVGTPVIVLAGTAFFGPVCSSILRGEQATAMFDGLLALAKAPSFAELKRGRDDLDFN